MKGDGGNSVFRRKLKSKGSVGDLLKHLECRHWTTEKSCLETRLGELFLAGVTICPGFAKILKQRYQRGRYVK